jgi:LmbE family N-acetylglucosaminyl deacetylase
LNFPLDKSGESVLVVAAHPDDEILGCGGTIAKLVKKGYEVNCLIAAEGISSRVALSESEKKSLIKSLHSNMADAHKLIGISNSKILNLPDNQMDTVPLLDIIQKIEQSIDELKPSHVITHSSLDVNIDHRILNDAVLAATRPQPGSKIQSVFFFEVPSSTEWRFSNNSFSPNTFVDITNEIDLKIKALNCYDSEMRPHPHPRSYENVIGLSTVRGSMVGVNNAESFEMSRVTI